MHYIINIDKCGISIRYGETLKSYALHNFSPPKNSPLLYVGDALAQYQVHRWTRFLKLALKTMKHVSVIKNNKLIFSKGGAK